MDYGKKVRFGGFDVLKYKKDEMSFIKVSTIMGNWSMEYREDCLLYHCLDSDLSEEDKESLSILIVNAFMVSNFLDAELQHSVMVAVGEFSERIKGTSEPVSEEEDAEILKNLQAEHEAMEFANGEEGKTEA